MPNPPVPSGHMTVEDVAADLGIEVNAMWQRLKRNRRERIHHLVPPFTRHGRRYLIHRDDYATWKAGVVVRERLERVQQLREEAGRHRLQAAILEREADALESQPAPAVHVA